MADSKATLIFPNSVSEVRNSCCFRIVGRVSCRKPPFLQRHSDEGSKVQY